MITIIHKNTIYVQNLTFVRRVFDTILLSFNYGWMKQRSVSTEKKNKCIITYFLNSIIWTLAPEIAFLFADLTWLSVFHPPTDTAVEQNAVGVTMEQCSGRSRCSSGTFLEHWAYLSWAWWRADPVYSVSERSSSRARSRPPRWHCGPLSGSGSGCRPAGKQGHRSLPSNNPTNTARVLC